MRKKLVVGITIVIIFLGIIIIIPLLFKEKIKEAVINTANTHLNATLEIEDLSLNFLSDFPHATVYMDNVNLVGSDSLNADTLIQSKSIKASINIFKLMRGKYDISQIELDSTLVLAKTSPEGRNNWDIVKKDSVVKETSPLNLKLQRILLNHCYFVYDDQISNTMLRISDWNGRLLGDFTADKTIIETESTAEEISFVQKGVSYVKNLKVSANAVFNADLKNQKFTLSNSSLYLNHVKLGVDGSITVLTANEVDYDLKFRGEDIHFKDILSLMPVIYTTKSFKDIESTGNVSFQGYVKGVRRGKEYPAFKFQLSVTDGMFQYPSLPQSMRDINLDMLLSGKDGSLDNSIIDIRNFSFSAGDHSFRSNLKIQTPVSDLRLDAHIDGTFDLEIIKEIYPLEKGTELAGQLISNLDVTTQPSDTTKGEYDDIKATGYLNLNNVKIKSGNIPDIVIEGAKMQLKSKDIRLSLLNAQVKNSDLSVTGSLDNLLGYIIKGQLVKGQLNVKSKYLKTDDFSTGKNASSSLLIIPSNIEGSLKANINKAVYGHLNLTNVNTGISMKNGIATIDNFSAITLGGSCKVNGTYNTASNTQNPRLDFALNLNTVSFAETVKSLELAQLYTPIFKSVSGNYSMNFKFATILDSNKDKTLANLNGNGWLRTDQVKVKGAESLGKLSSLLKINIFNSFTTQNVYVVFSVKDSKITTEPFDVNINHFKLNLGGTTGFDQSIDYKGTVFIPKYTIVGLVSDVGFKIKGDFSNPQISLLPKPTIKSTINTTTEKISEGARKVGTFGSNLSKKVLHKK